MIFKRYTCPKCRSKDGVDIIYGMPSLELQEQAEQGLVALGGCEIEDMQPERRCMKCGNEWMIRRFSMHPPSLN